VYLICIDFLSVRGFLHVKEVTKEDDVVNGFGDLCQVWYDRFPALTSVGVFLVAGLLAF